jgi:hypothetical protein
MVQAISLVLTKKPGTFTVMCCYRKISCWLTVKTGLYTSKCHILYGRLVWRPSTTLIKKKIKFSSYIREFRAEQLQSHIWGRLPNL